MFDSKFDASCWDARGCWLGAWGREGAKSEVISAQALRLVPQNGSGRNWEVADSVCCVSNEDLSYRE